MTKTLKIYFTLDEYSVSNDGISAISDILRGKKSLSGECRIESLV